MRLVLILLVTCLQSQGWIQDFLKGGLYTTEVTLNTNGVEGE